MDQIKTGKFIAELRKTHGFTQLQLADKLGVSDKTVSRWECGKGMPELSILMPLCDVLEINVNELLSGEHLSLDNYSQKAEENMLSLIQESEANKAGKFHAFLAVALAGIVVVASIVLTLLLGGISGIEVFDFISLLLLLIPTVLFLLATGLLCDFGNAFRILLGRAQETADAVNRAKEAVTMTARTMLWLGVLISMLQVFAVLYSYEGDNVTALCRSLSVALLSLLYGIITYLILIPIRSRLNLL